MSTYLGDFVEDETLHYIWDTNNASGASASRTGDSTMDIRVYKDNGATQSVAGITDTADFDGGLTGIHALTIDLSADAFYATGANYSVVLVGDEIDGQAVNAVLCHFSIENRSALRATVAGRTLGVEADGDLTKVNTLDGHTPQTADHAASIASILDDTGTTIPATLGTPSSLGLAGDLGDVKDDTAAILTDTNEMQGKLPTNNIMGSSDKSDKDDEIDAILVDTGTTIPATLGTPSSNGLAGDLADLPFNVWDEVLTGATHNIADSAGRRLRDLQEFGVYEGGAIWIDTVNGTAGTTDFESGTVFNPVDSIEDANTLAASLGISRFRVAPGSSIVFGSAGPQVNQEFFGTGWTLDLGGQDIAGTTIHGAAVSGTGVGSGYAFLACMMGTCTLADGELTECGLSATITASAAGDYFFHMCHSHIAGTGAPTFDIGAGVGNTSLNFRHYSGGIEIENMNQTGADTMSLEGFGQLILNANCAGGTIAIRGNFTVTDNAGGAVTLSDDARIDVDQITDAILDDSTQFSGADIAAILADTGTTIPATLGTPSSNGLSGDIDDLKGATFDSSTDSLEAIRNRGDAAWTTGAGGTPPDLLQSTTIATLATQVSFTLTAGSADDDAYNDALIVVTDSATSEQKAVGIVSNYTGGSKTVTLLADPGIFTMAVGDTVDIIAFKGALASVCTEARLAELDAGNLPSDIDDILEDTGTTIPATLGTPSSNGLAGDLGDVQDDTAAILVDTGTTIPATLGTPSSNGLAGDLGDVQADIAAVPTAVENRTEMDSNSTQLAAIVSNQGTPSSNGLAGDIGDLNALIAALNDLSAADVNAEIVDVLFTDTISELSQGIPAVTPTIATALMLIYMRDRDKIDITSGFKEIHNDAGTVIAKKALSDDGTTYSEAKMESG